MVEGWIGVGLGLIQLGIRGFRVPSAQVGIDSGLVWGWLKVGIAQVAGLPGWG